MQDEMFGYFLVSNLDLYLQLNLASEVNFPEE